MASTHRDDNLPGNHANYPPEIYEGFDAYPFATDPEFRLGLASLLGQPGAPVTDEQINREDDLVLRAKSFYYSRKHGISPHIDPEFYKAWKEDQTWQTVDRESVNEGDGSINQTDAVASAQEPSYPTSFARIVELITTGQPIPGIEQIPDTVLTGHEGPSTAQPRKKPWEKDEPEQTNEGNGNDPFSTEGAAGAGKETATS